MEDFEIFNLGCPNCDELAIEKLVWVEYSDCIACKSCGFRYESRFHSLPLGHGRGIPAGHPI